MKLTLSGGLLRRDDRCWRAIGVNYHPSAAGCRIWLDWDPETFERDFRAISECGLNTVRLFVFWRDAEPDEGQHDPIVLQRIRVLVQAAGRHGLACVLSVFTIWMNGERLDLPWRQGRDLWRDPVLLSRSEAYLRAVAGVLRGLDNVLAIDLGDEIGNADPASSARLSRAEAAAWQARMAGAVRDVLPGMLVCQANDVSGVLGSSPFGPDNGTGLDLHAVHSWPLWTPGAVESTSSVKASQLPGFLTSYASAFGPALVDELGSYGTSEAVAAGYQRAAGATAIAAGALGVFAWCWQDIASAAPPYDTRPAERRAGLLRLDGTARPALAAICDTARLAAMLAEFRPGPAAAAVYLPDLLRAGQSSYLDTPAGTVASFFATLLLRRLGLPHRMVADAAGDADLLLIPSASRLTLGDHARICQQLSRGGTVYLSVADHVGALPDPGLTGVEFIDFCRTGPDDHARDRMHWTGTQPGAAAAEWPLDRALLGDRQARIRPLSARVLATFTDGSPACTISDTHPGQLVLVPFPLEMQLDRPDALESTELHSFYGRVAAVAGIGLRGTVPPGMDIVPGTIADQPAAVLINHGTTPSRLPGARFGAAAPVTVPAKGWLVISAGRPLGQAGDTA